MSSAPSPPEPPVPPPPASVVRRKTDGDTWGTLSKDGLAAVLLHARALLRHERRGEDMRALELYRFVRRVMRCAKEATEGIHDNDYVFIAPLYQDLRARKEIEGLTLASFKARLLQAYHQDQLRLAECVITEGINPMILQGSTIGRSDNTFHLVHRWWSGSLHDTLDDVIAALSKHAAASVTAYARKVREDERLRERMPRLVTVSPEAFAARVQTITNQGSGEMLVAEVFRRLSERGEMTGMGLSEFKARLLAGHRAGRLFLCAGDIRGRSAELVEASAITDEGITLMVVQRTGPAPIPWGPPPQIVAPRRLW